MVQFNIIKPYQNQMDHFPLGICIYHHMTTHKKDPNYDGTAGMYQKIHHIIMQLFIMIEHLIDNVSARAKPIGRTTFLLAI